MENQTPDFNAYNLQNLMDDQQFVNWVLQPDEQLDLYWQTVLGNYPHIALPAQQARQIILSLKFTPVLMDPGEQETLWRNIADQTIREAKPAFIIPLWLRTAVAAVLAGLLISIGLYLYQNRQTSVTTTYGQTKAIILPDGSAVTLNANSLLRYASNWKKDKPREVWVDGEAFFKVNHLHRTGEIRPGERFVVHAGRANVEVLGTTFNINDRRDEVKVTLITGKVSFSLATYGRAAIIMRPGELVQYESNQGTITKHTTDTTARTDWRNGILHFNHTEAGEVFRYIEDGYGYKTIFKKPDIAGKRITGVFSNKNLDALLKAVATSLDITIQKDVVTHQLTVNY